MESKEYIAQAIVTENDDFTGIGNRIQPIPTMRLLHGAMGLSTEAGELLDALKKSIFYGKPIDAVNIAEELGDLFWYAAVICDVLGTTFEPIMRQNLQKLRARYPNKFKEYDANHRDLKKERDILEGFNRWADTVDRPR